MQHESSEDDYSVSWLHYAIGCFLIVVIITAILGNLLVCIAIYSDRRLRKLGNLFIVSLAVADLFVSSLVMTFAVANDLMGYWAFGPRFCDTWIAFDVMCSTASILNLCAISLDRFIHIKDPLRYCRWMSKRVVVCVIFCLWMLSALISFLPISLGWHRPSDEEVLLITDFNATVSDLMTDGSGSELPAEVEVVEPLPICSLDLTPEYAVLSSLISFYIPCLVMIALYARLYLYARKHVREIRSLNKPLHQGFGGPNSGSNVTHTHEHKAAFTLGIIVGVFLVCWVPFFAANIAAGFCKLCVPDMCFKFLTWLGYLNSALNPIIYSIFNTEFREAFKKIITTHLLWCPKSSSTSSLNHSYPGNHHYQHEDGVQQERILLRKSPPNLSNKSCSQVSAI